MSKLFSDQSKGLINFDQKSLAGTELLTSTPHTSSNTSLTIPHPGPQSQQQPSHSIPYSGSKPIPTFPHTPSQSNADTFSHRSTIARQGLPHPRFSSTPFPLSPLTLTRPRPSPEYHHKILTRAAGGNPRLGCYLLAVTIFGLGIFRDLLYERALRNQPSSALLHSLPADLIAYSLLVIGNTLVLSSMWALGITGTYLGDYFGILMDEPVTSFPFNITSAPMYYGSTLSFLGTAILYGKPAGVLLTVEVLVVYLIALRFEE